MLLEAHGTVNRFLLTVRGWVRRVNGMSVYLARSYQASAPAPWHFIRGVRVESAPQPPEPPLLARTVDQKYVSLAAPEPPKAEHDFSDPYLRDKDHRYCSNCAMKDMLAHPQCLGGWTREQVRQHIESLPTDFRSPAKPPVRAPRYDGPATHGVRSVIGGPVRLR